MDSDYMWHYDDGDYEFGYDDDNDDDDDDCNLNDNDEPLGAGDGECMDDSEEPVSKHVHNCRVLTEADIRQRQEDDIAQISTLLSVSRVAASILLRHHKWSVSNLHESWFADIEKVKEDVGFLGRKTMTQHSSSKKVTCGICFDLYHRCRMNAADCGHLFCSSCWKGYISTSINEGPGCLMLQCPEPSCHAAVGQDMIDKLASDEDKEKYSRHLVRSYVEDNKNIKWCPAPGCECAIDFVLGSDNYDVSCSCTHRFCWNCTQDAHRPVDCETVAKWILKYSSQSKNMKWILAHSKPCPKCKRSIEKNCGCMHMTCGPPCKFEFCWLCLGSWLDHGQSTGGFYACNGFEAAKRERTYYEIEERRENAKQSPERYMHYYERWATNESSIQKAVLYLQKMQSVEIEKLCHKQCQPKTQLTFIIDAWLQIIDCRRVLKWTYAYGYYLYEDEDANMQLFQYLQGEAESGLERLHQCAEKELEGYLIAKGPSKNFSDFRIKLVGLTSVTRNFFENLVQALENGLSKVHLHNGICSKSGKGQGGKNMGKNFKYHLDMNEYSYWSCEHCTFANSKSNSFCEMCEHSRYAII